MYRKFVNVYTYGGATMPYLQKTIFPIFYFHKYLKVIDYVAFISYTRYLAESADQGRLIACGIEDGGWHSSGGLK